MAEIQADVRIASGAETLYGRFVQPTPAAPATMLLLPGLGFHSFEYLGLQPQLACAGLASLALDWRGHGLSSGRRGVWTLQHLVADARAAIDWIGAMHPGVVLLLGNSLGAMVAIATAQADARVAAVVACNAPARVDEFLMTPWRRALFSVAKAAAAVLPLRISVDHFYAYADLVDDARLVRRIASDAAIRAARRLSIAAYRSLIDDWDGVREVARLAQPLLLVQGLRDRLQPAEQTEALFAAAREPKELVRLDTGHLPTLERPDLLAAAVLDWLARSGIWRRLGRPPAGTHVTPARGRNVSADSSMSSGRPEDEPG